MELSAEQSAAVKHLGRRSNWRGMHAWLAGYAGSGKTSIAPHLAEELGGNVLFLAPTNKAAKVLRSKIDRPAQTIHSAIYFAPGESERGGLTWTINPDGAASKCSLIVVDEASMVGSELGADLMRFGKPVLAIGDPGQLPPVQDTPYFCVGEPDFMLKEIHRQAADNPIIALSQDVRRGNRLRPGRMGDAVWIARPGQVDIPDADPPQVIVGTHKRRWAVTAAMRERMGFEGWLPQGDEKLVVRKTSNRLINGQEAIARSAEETDEEYELDFSVQIDEIFHPCTSWDGLFREHHLRERIQPKYLTPDWIAYKQNEVFDFGWAITCHVAQGSQWDDVIVFDESRVFREDAARWLYTAVTRAAERLTVIV